MASVKFEKGSAEWLMFQDYWKMCQKFWIPEDNDEYWESLISEATNFYKKYSSEIFAKKLAIAFIENLDKKIRCIQQEPKELESYPFRVCGFVKKYPFLGETIINLIEDISPKMISGEKNGVIYGSNP